MEINFYNTDFITFLSQFKQDERGCYYIPVKYFGSDSKQGISPMTLIAIQKVAKMNGMEIIVSQCYNNSQVLIKEIFDYMKTYYLPINYQKREEYYDIMYEINSLKALITSTLFVSNVPGYLDAAYLFEFPDNVIVSLKELENKYGVVFKNDKNLISFFSEMGSRQWNMMSFCEMKKEDFLFTIKSMFMFPSDLELKQDGYNFNKKSYTPKVFISYCWKDDQTVSKVVELLQNEFNLWIDKKDIDYGDHIYMKMHQGLEESDIFISFISNNYANSCMAKDELLTFWSEAMHGRKEKVLVIKLDDVELNKSFFYGFDQYKYFDYPNEPITNFIHSLKKKVEKIQQDKLNQQYSTSTR